MDGITPHWELLHEWKIDDIEFEIKDRDFFIEMLVMHPEDDVGIGYRSLISLLNKKIKVLRNQYKAIYGKFPKRKIYSLIQP